MNAKEKKALNEELNKFHGELETWLLKWYPTTAREIRPALKEKFDKFQKRLNLKSK